jgi:hypothetical protein
LLTTYRKLPLNITGSLTNHDWQPTENNLWISQGAWPIMTDNLQKIISEYHREPDQSWLTIYRKLPLNITGSLTNHDSHSTENYLWISQGVWPIITDTLDPIWKFCPYSSTVIIQNMAHSSYQKLIRSMHSIMSYFKTMAYCSRLCTYPVNLMFIHWYVKQIFRKNKTLNKLTICPVLQLLLICFSILNSKMISCSHFFFRSIFVGLAFSDMTNWDIFPS